MARHMIALTTMAMGIVLFAASAEVRAVMLGAYDFENADGLTSVDSDANSLAGDIIPGPGLPAAANTSRGETNVAPFVAGTNDQSFSFAQFNAATASAAAARAAGDYFSFTVSAEPTYQLDLDDLTFRAALSNVVLSRTWTLDYSINGGSFVTGFDSDVFTGPQTTSSNTPVWTPFTVDLSGAVFDALNSITFRLVQHGDFNTTHAVFFDKIALNGTTLAAIPEPSTLVCLTLGGCCVFRLRRRNTRG